MVQVKYKGQNYIMFGTRKIVNGQNDIPDEEFYKLMNHPSFASRISSKVFEVPSGFSLVNPNITKKVAKDKTSEDHNDSHDLEDDEEEKTGDRLSIKQTLKIIQKSDDFEYLKGLLDSDDRQKVKDAAQKRLDYLQSEDRK